MIERAERWTSIDHGALPLPEPFDALVCADYPTDRSTFWSRLRYEQWPLLVLSSAEVGSSNFEPVGSTAVTDGRVSIPPDAVRGTKLERWTRDDGSLTMEDGTWFVLLAQDDMLTGDVRSAYALTIRQAGSLRQIFALLPTPE